MARPLQPLDWNSSTCFESDGILYAGLKSNAGDSNYAFKLNTFRLNLKSIAGVKQDDNYWLVGNCNNAGGGEAFDLIIKDPAGQKVTDKNQIEALDKKWTVDSSMAVALLCTGIDSFEVLAQVSSENNLILVDQNIETQQFHLMSLGEEKPEAIKQLSELVFLWIKGYETSPQKPWEADECDKILDYGEWLGQRGLFYVPICGQDDPRLEDIATNIGTRMKAVWKYCLPPLADLTQMCPHTGIKITLPAAKKKGAWSGSKSESTAEAIKARETYLLDKFKLDGCGTLEDIYRSVVPEKSRGSSTYLDFLLKVMG